MRLEREHVILVPPQSRLARLGAAFGCLARVIVWPHHRVDYGQMLLYVTEGRSFERCFAAFGKTVDGRRLLDQRPDSVAVLRDRVGQHAAGEASLARAYGEFMRAHQIDEDLYLAGAIAAGHRFGRDQQRGWFRTRVEAAHDLRHLLTGYGIDIKGEICLLAFRYGQTRHPGILMVILLGLLPLIARFQVKTILAIWEAHRRGRAAPLLDLLVWEEQFDRPLADVRRQFGLAPPKRYLASLAG